MTDDRAGAEEAWERETNTFDVVTCPVCAFTFDAGHEDEGGGWSCPVCAEIALRERNRRLKEANDNNHARAVRAETEVRRLHAALDDAQEAATSAAAELDEAEEREASYQRALAEAVGSGRVDDVPTPSASALQPEPRYLCWCDGSACSNTTSEPGTVCEECARLGHRPLPTNGISASALLVGEASSLDRAIGPDSRPTKRQEQTP